MTIVSYSGADALVWSPAFSHVAVVSGAVRTIYVGGQDAVTADNEIWTALRTIFTPNPEELIA